MPQALSIHYKFKGTNYQARKLHKNLHNPQNISIRKITTLVKSNLKNKKTVPYLLLLLSSAGFCGLRRGWRSFVLLGRLHQQENKGKKAIEIEEAPDKKKDRRSCVRSRKRERSITIVFADKLHWGCQKRRM